MKKGLEKLMFYKTICGLRVLLSSLAVFLLLIAFRSESEDLMRRLGGFWFVIIISLIFIGLSVFLLWYDSKFFYIPSSPRKYILVEEGEPKQVGFFFGIPKENQQLIEMFPKFLWKQEETLRSGLAEFSTPEVFLAIKLKLTMEITSDIRLRDYYAYCGGGSPLAAFVGRVQGKVRTNQRIQDLMKDFIEGPLLMRVEIQKEVSAVVVRLSQEANASGIPIIIKKIATGLEREYRTV